MTNSRSSVPERRNRETHNRLIWTHTLSPAPPILKNWHTRECDTKQVPIRIGNLLFSCLHSKMVTGSNEDKNTGNSKSNNEKIGSNSGGNRKGNRIFAWLLPSCYQINGVRTPKNGKGNKVTAVTGFFLLYRWKKSARAQTWFLQHCTRILFFRIEEKLLFSCYLCYLYI